MNFLKKLSLLLILVLILCVGCSEKTKPVSQTGDEQTKDNSVVNEESTDLESETESKPETPESETNEIKEYYGQALSSSKKNGSVKIYEKPDSKSKVIGTLKDLEMIKLLESVPYGWFKVETDDSKIGYMDARLVRTKEIPPHEYSEKAEGYNLVFTHSDQKLKIYKDGELVKESLGSSGLWDHFTPKGVFELEKKRRGKWAYIPRFEMGFKYWVGFKGVYLFHSVPYDEKKQLLEDEAKKIGQPASHGCIRLPVEMAKYIYENVPAGSKVLIY